MVFISPVPAPVWRLLSAGRGVRAHGNTAVSERGMIPLPDRSVDVAIMAVESETGRNHPDHRVRGAIERKRCAQDAGRSSELAFPQTAAQNSDRRRANAIIVGNKRAAEDGPNLQSR